jgi:hypothetical protein
MSLTSFKVSGLSIVLESRVCTRGDQVGDR